MRTPIVDGQSIDRFIPAHLRKMFFKHAMPEYKYAIHDGYAPYSFSTEGLVLYFPLWALKGSPIQSVDAYQHAGTVTGALWRPNGRDFDVIDDFINCGQDAAFNIEDEITLETFIIAGGNGLYRGLAGKWLHVAPFNNSAYLLLITNGDYLSLRVSKDGTVGAASRTYLIGSTTTIVDGTAYYLVGTYKYVGDGSSEMRIYVNGALEATTDTAVGDIFALPTQDLHVGKYGTTGASAYPCGSIVVETRISHRVLSIEEIQHNYEVIKWRSV